MTPPPAEKLEKSVERADWKKPASDRNHHEFSVFFKLPPEVRPAIYSDLIKSGNLELLHLCQKIHSEAIGMIYRDGIYRVKTKTAAQSYFCYAALPGPLNRISEEVQNVEVYTRLGYVTYLKTVPDPSVITGEIWDLRPELKDPKISGKNCWIYVSKDDIMNELKHFTVLSLTILLRTVQQFDNVFLNVHGSTSQFYDTSESWWLKHIADWDSRLEMVRDALEPEIGPATWRDNPDPIKQYWVFHPRRARPEGYLTTAETNEKPTLTTEETNGKPSG